MCDLAIASKESKFATSGINYGLFCSTPAVGISRTMQSKHAFEMLMTGDFLTAADAERRGLINKSVKRSDLDDEVLKLATKISSQVSTSMCSSSHTLSTCLKTVSACSHSTKHDHLSSLSSHDSPQEQCETESNCFINNLRWVWRRLIS